VKLSAASGVRSRRSAPSACPLHSRSLRRGRDSLRCSAAAPPALLGTFGRIQFGPAARNAPRCVDGPSVRTLHTAARRASWSDAWPRRFESLPENFHDDPGLLTIFSNFCGEGGIRTLGTVARTHDFQSCTFGHSVTSPGAGLAAAPGGGAVLCQREEREQVAEFTVKWLNVALTGGESGIRTHGTLTGTPDFESGTFGRSVISPPRTMTAEAGAVNAWKVSLEREVTRVGR
jgi:hypothetical protein